MRTKKLVFFLFFLISGCASNALRHQSTLKRDFWLHDNCEAIERTLKASYAEKRISFEELVLLASLEEYLGHPTAALNHLSEAIEKYWQNKDKQGKRESYYRALAELSALQISFLENKATHWSERIKDLSQKLRTKKSSPRLTQILQGLNVQIALKKNAPQELEESIATAGCLTKWKAIGPFGPFPLLSFEDVHEPGQPGAINATYDLGFGRGKIEPFDPIVEGCKVELIGPLLQWGGTTYGMTYVDLQEATQATLLIESYDSMRVFINDVKAVEVDRRQNYLPRSKEVNLWLPSGRNKIVIALTSRYAGPVMRVHLLDADGKPLTQQTTATTKIGYRAVSPQVLEPFQRPQPQSIVDFYLLSLLAQSEGNPEEARGILNAGPRELRESWIGRLLYATTWVNDRTVPFDVARNRVLTSLNRASQIESRAWRPYFEQARFHLEEERMSEAMEVVQKGLEKSPEHPLLLMLYATILSMHGLWSEAENTIDKIEELTPSSCEHLFARYDLATRRNRSEESNRIAEQILNCDHRSGLRANRLIAAEKWQEALRELQRLIELRGEQVSFLAPLAEVYRALGREEEEANLLSRLLDRNPEDHSATLDLTDMAIFHNQREKASTILNQQISRVPGNHLVERQILARLSDRNVLDLFRLDSNEVIQNYESANRNYNAPSVLVLDRTIFRVYPDGSIVEYTHNIKQVQSSEGIDEEGEFRVPQDSELLAIRTIKEDGTILEPENIRGKDTLSLPNLEPGDYIDVAYLRGIEPPPEFPGGFWPWRFYFQGRNQAFHRSELMVISAIDRELDFSWRREPLQEENWVAGNLRIYRWVAREVGLSPREPHSPNYNEILPSLLVSSGATWNLFRQTLREALADRNRISQELSATAHSILQEAGSETDSEALDALYHWVVNHVQDGGGPLASVSHMFASRTGERTRLVAAMARAVDIEAFLGYARSSYADQTEDKIPSFNIYSYPVFRSGSRWMYVGDQARWAPSCLIPPDLRGQKVLMVDGEDLFDEIPDNSCQPDQSHIEVTIAIEENGRVSGEVEEVHSGAVAQLWRSTLAKTPEAERRGMLEEDHIADVLPGAEIFHLHVHEEENTGQPIRISYKIRRLQLLSHVSDKKLRIQLPFQPRMASSYATLANRRTPLVIHNPVDESVKMVFILPVNSQIERLEDGNLINPHSEYTLTKLESRDPRILTLERRLSIHPGRVYPNEYDAFASYCRQVDELQEQRIEINRGGGTFQ